MSIILKKAAEADCPIIHQIQTRAFLSLLDKYQDFETNPAAEPLERICQRFAQEFTDYYLICLNDIRIGIMRICDWGEVCRLSPICILPEFQGHGYAQQAIIQAEALYPNAKIWKLDTILQEPKLCHLYEKMGYHRTGESHRIKDGMDLVCYSKEI